VATIVVNSGGNLQAALNSAVGGDTILLDASATYQGAFSLPIHSGASYVDITTNTTIPAAGVRVSPASAATFAKLQPPVGGSPSIATVAGANYWRFIGIEFLPTPSSLNDIIALGDGSSAQTSLSQVPEFLVLDRCYIHGDATNGQKRGISLNCGTAEIKNCYISNIKRVGQDTQAICGWNGPGPWLIDNNYLEAAGENFLVGGATINIPNMIPSNITFTNNTVYKPLAWRGQGYTIKNLLELKTGDTVDIKNNSFENCWGGEGQSGYGIVFTVRNEEGSNNWATIKNVTFSNNTLKKCGNGIQVLGKDDRSGITSVEMNGLIISDNVLSEINGSTYTGNGWAIVLNNGGNGIAITHNDLLNVQLTQGVSIYLLNSRQFTNLNISNNFIMQNGLGVYGDQQQAQGTPTLNLQAVGYQFVNNVLVGIQTGTYPATSMFVSGLSSVGFTDLAGGNYTLVAGSTYADAASDTGPIGSRNLGVFGGVAIGYPTLSAAGTVSVTSTAAVAIGYPTLSSVGTITPPVVVAPDVGGLGGVILGPPTVDAVGTPQYVQSGTGGIVVLVPTVSGNVQQGSKRRPRKKVTNG
tara:strand:- start:163 stop:1908 length:1746 start_codon:yes stop_codon:yes gene_type:complete